MASILGRKIGMTQVFDKNGKLIPVTVLKAGPCTILDIKTKEKDAYQSVQIGFEEKKDKNSSKAILGHIKKAKQEKAPRFIRETRLIEKKDFKIGDSITVKDFKNIKYIDVIGKNKGKGFQGTVKRYNFAGGRASHGGDWLRKPGSIGMCQFPGKVIKGKKMPGHTGSKRKTVQNLQVVEVREDDHIIIVKGAVPGFNGSFITIQKSKKK